MGSMTRKLRIKRSNQHLAELGLGTGAEGRRNLRRGLAAAEAIEIGMSGLDTTPSKRTWAGRIADGLLAGAANV